MKNSCEFPYIIGLWWQICNIRFPCAHKFVFIYTEAIEIKCKKEEAEKKLNEKLENLKLPLPCGEEDQADGKMQAWMDKTILFTENPRNIQKVVFSQKGKMLNMRLVINDEEKTCDAGFKTWIRNDLYQDDYTKKHWGSIIKSPF